MKQNPCRYCALSLSINGKHYPRLNKECEKCENIKKHKAYLLSRRKFVEGEPITSLDDLMQQEWVMWYHSTKHIEVFKHMQLTSVLLFLKNGAFRKAIRKEVTYE